MCVSNVGQFVWRVVNTICKCSKRTRRPTEFRLRNFEAVPQR